MSPSPSRPDARLVCLPDELCEDIYNALAHTFPETIAKADEFHRRWKSAAADPAAVVAEWFQTHFELDHHDQRHSDVIAAHVLKALGFAGEATP